MMDETIEELAKVIFWAAWEMYEPGEDNPVARMTRDEAWEKTSPAHRKLARFQARRVLDHQNDQNKSSH